MKTIVTEPIYRQLSRVLREEIARGAYQPRDKFLSERKIAELYGVSRATANKVISNMVAGGLLVFRPGIGTFVSATGGLNTSLREMESFTEHASSRGLTPRTRVLDFARLQAARVPDVVREGLALENDSGEEVVFAERLRVADGEPVILEHRWIMSSLVPGLNKKDMQGSFYGLLQHRYRLYPDGEAHKIFARNLGTEEAKKLGTKRGSAALVVEGTGFSHDDTPIWYQVLLYRGDKYHLTNEVRSQRSVRTAVVPFRGKESA